MEMRKPISRSELPPGYGRFMADPEQTVARWQKRCDLRAEYEALRKKEGQIKKSPPAATDLHENIGKSFYDDYQPRILKKLGQYLKGCRGDLSNLDRRGHIYGLGPFFPLEILHLAVDQLSETQTGGIADEDRKTALAEIENEKSRVRAELAEVSPAGDFSFASGAVNKDLLDEFIAHWKNIQGSTKGACDCRGVDLKYSSELEQRFYYKLGLDKIVPARSAKYRPFEPGAAK